MRFPDISVYCTHRFLLFYFAGFISNLTQSTTCPLDSRTSYTHTSSQTTGKRIEIPFGDLLPCIVMLNFNCFIQPSSESLFPDYFTSEVSNPAASQRSIIYRNQHLQAFAPSDLLYNWTKFIFLAVLGPVDYNFASSKDWPKPWCSIAYWEQNERIGPSFEGTTDVINVFESLPDPSGFCLAQLNRRSDVSEGTKRVRAQIGYGLQLTREGDGIWIYNRSDYSLFANGPTLTYSNEKSAGGKVRHNILVHKVPPGYSLKVYDYKLSSQVCRAVDSAGVRCYHPESVRISFKKGWGATSASKKYCRPLVTSCPCWIEIHLFLSR